jgi:hypothetical protein
MHTACKSRAANHIFHISCSLILVSKCGLLLTLGLFSSWFIVGQLFASVALYLLKASDPLNYKTPIYTQVS